MTETKLEMADAIRLLKTSVGADVVNSPRHNSSDTSIYLSPPYQNDWGWAVQIVDENGHVVCVVEYAEEREAFRARTLFKDALAMGVRLQTGAEFAHQDAGFGSPNEVPIDEID